MSPKKHKYNAKRSKCGQSHYHGSKGEAARCDYLYLKFKAGHITEPVQQRGIEIVKGFRYKPDFAYEDDGKQVYEDFKGVMTQRFRDIARMWPHHGKGVLRISQMAGNRFISHDVFGLV